MKIGIVELSTSNLFSVRSACEYFNLNTVISSDKSVLKNVDALILPGVGSFKEAMNFLNKKKLIDLIHEFKEKEKKIMGICLGFQLLFSESIEFGSCKGLGLLEGKVENLSLENKKIHTGWNRIDKKKKSNVLTEQELNLMYYFTHSFIVKPKDESIILTNTMFNNLKFCSSVEYKNIFGCQFHPEKSGKQGIKIYYNFFKN